MSKNEKIRKVRQFLLDTKGRRFGVQWTTKSGRVRTANAHLPSRLICKEGGQHPDFKDYFRAFDHNEKHLVTITMSKVNYLSCGEISLGRKIEETA